jgi:hypothetical protein
MRLQRRQFLKATLGLPFGVAMNKISPKERPTQLPKQEGDYLPLAYNLFEKYQVYPGELAEAILDEVPEGTPVDEIPRAVFMDPFDKNAHIPRRWEYGKCHCIIPRYEVSDKDKSVVELSHKLLNKIEQDCRHILIAAGQWNIQMYGTLPEIHRKIHTDLGEDCIIFNRWIGPPPHFYRYTVGVKKVPGNLLMPVWEEPTFFMHKRLSDEVTGWMEIGLAVVNHKHISIGREPNELRDTKELVAAIA